MSRRRSPMRVTLAPPIRQDGRPLAVDALTAQAIQQILALAADGQVLFRDGGVIVGDAGLTYDKANNWLGLARTTPPTVTLHIGDDGPGGGNVIINGFLRFRSDSQHEIMVEDTGNSASLSFVGGGNFASFIQFKTTYGVGTADYIKFLVGNNGAVEALRIISDGKVGIGIAIPTEKLHVSGNAIVTGALTVGGVDVNDHSARHENGGADEISVAGLSGVLADLQPAIPGGADTQVQFNDGGALGGDAGLIYDKTNNRLGINRTTAPGFALHIGDDDAGVGEICLSGRYIRFRSNQTHEIVVENSLSSANLEITGGGNEASFIKMRSTYGVGVSDYISLCVGNNGATEGLRVLSSGAVRLPAGLEASSAAGVRAFGTQTSASTGTVNNFDITTGRNGYVYFTGASALTLTGFKVNNATPVEGDWFIAKNDGTSTVRIAEEDAGSTAEHRVDYRSIRGQILGGGGSVLCVYLGGAIDRWRMTLLDPGAPIPVTFAAGDFTGNGSMDWDVDVTQVLTHTYVQRGNEVAVTWAIHGTTVGGTLSDELRIGIPASFTPSLQTWGVLSWLDDNGTPTTGSVFSGVSDSHIRMLRTNLANFSAATFATATAGTITLTVL